MPPRRRSGPGKQHASRLTPPLSTEAKDSHAPIYFWREYGSPHSYLSQWYPSPFTILSTQITYSTAEQYMMHQKALLFSDTIVASQILASNSPKEQKALGRKVANFDDEVWKQNRERIVEEASYWKFKIGRDKGELKGEGVGLRRMLEGTEESQIVEASPRDRIWGIGFGEKNAGKRKPDWGLNLLGKAIMAARKRLREEVEEGGEGEKQELEDEKTPERDGDDKRETKRRKKSKN